MIAHLQGIVLEKRPEETVIDVHGVGYRVLISLHTFEQLPEPGASCRLLIHTLVREDAFHLYGFTRDDERNLFKHLNNVNGIGPRLALAVLSAMSPRSLVTAIVTEDVSSLVRIPGIGKKIAQRIVIELKERLAPLAGVPDENRDETEKENADRSGEPREKELAGRQALLSALLNLGYRRADADRAIQELPPEAWTDFSLGLRSALKVLTR
ncbi:MAG: Holliday junction branch migration protein RuvA [Magnetococcales bacterium]|nr:Holliday junction branch migration protein RuvA [Magnetococcales bacterium]